MITLFKINEMHTKLRWTFTALMMALVLMIGFTSTAACSKSSTQGDRIGVVVSITPLAEFVEAVGGDKVGVSVMVPPGASPHAYEPTPSQLIKVSNADIFVKAGSGVEFELVWMDKIIETNRDMLVADSSEGIELIQSVEEDGHEDEEEHEHGGLDPHIWTSPINAVRMVANIYEALARIDPDNKSYYEDNRDLYVKELEALDTDIRSQLTRSGVKEFIVFHPAWGYFARDYGLEEIPIEVEGKEPSAEDMARLIEEAQEKGIEVIFVEPQFNPQSAQVIANAIGGVVVSIDPLARDYAENLRKVAGKLAQLEE
jgi:zinc transport system substrate-binding protein